MSDCSFSEYDGIHRFLFGASFPHVSIGKLPDPFLLQNDPLERRIQQKYY